MVSRELVFRYSLRNLRVQPGPSRNARALLAVVLGIGLLALPAATSQADEGDPVKITGLSIAALPISVGAPNQNHVVILKGTFTNTSERTITKLNLNLVYTPAITTRSELAGLIADPTSANNLIPTDTSAILRNIGPGISKNWQINL